MLRALLSSLKRDPFGFTRRALFKAIIGPIKYRERDGYNAARYWHDRFTRYGLSPRGAGDESLSQEENSRMYEEAARVFTRVCRRKGVDFENVSVLDIGCGNGFYTGLLRDLGVADYVGIDITDVLFAELIKRFPKFSFIKKDITTDTIDGSYNLIVMIDVIEHIVTEAKLSFAMENIKNSLAANGIFAVSPIMDVSKRHLFYNRLWSFEDIQQRFTGYELPELVPFRGNQLLTIRKPPASEIIE